jgi:hypothetical protein
MCLNDELGYQLLLLLFLLPIFYALVPFVGFHLQFTYLALGLKDFVAYSKYHYVILDL